MSIRTELEEFAGIEKKKKESEAEYVKRLIIAVDQKMTDEVFDELDGDVQDWINSAVEAVEDETDIPPFPDEEEPPKEELEEEPEEEEEEEEEKPAKKAKAEKKKETPAKEVKSKPEPKPEKKDSKKKEPKTEPEKKPAKKTESAKPTSKAKSGTVPSVRIVQLAVEFPQANAAELSKMLKKEGKELNITTIRAKSYIAREAATYLKSIGKLK